MTKRVLAVFLTLALILSNISGLGLVTNVHAADVNPNPYITIGPLDGSCDRADENGIITFEAAWGDCPGNGIYGDSINNYDLTGYDSAEIVIDSVSDYCQIQILYNEPETENAVLGFGSAGTYYLDLDPTKTVHQWFVQSGKVGTTVKITSIKFRKAPSEDLEIATLKLIENSMSVAKKDFSGPKIEWGTKAIDNLCPDWSTYLKAMKTPSARFVLKYEITGEPGVNDKGEDDRGWMNFFQSSTNPGGGSHIGFANWEGGASKMKCTLNGEASNQWSLLDNGSHVITYDCAYYLELLSSHTCNDYHPNGGVTIDDTTGLSFQSGLAGTLAINITDLYIEYPVLDDEEDPDPDPEVPDPVEHPENEEEIDITNGDSKGRQFPYSDTEAHIFPLKRALCVGEKVTVHISGTSDSDFRFWLCNDENGAISSDTKYASNDYGVTPGSFDFTFELEVKKVDIDIAAYIQFKGTAWDKPLDNFTITHLAVVYPELEPVEPPVCEEDHEGWTIVDVTDLAQKTGRFYVPFAGGDEARVGDSVEFHFIGTANTEKETGAIRFYAVEGDGWDNNLSGAQANKASIFNGIFEFSGKIEEITNVGNGKNTTPESVAKGLMFDVTGDGYKDVTFTHFAYKIVSNAEYTLSAMTDCDGKSVGNITVSPAKDSYVSGDEITLTAPSVLGYDFLGWYKGVEQVCENLVYTFTITANTELVAKYKVNDTPALVTIKVENGNACIADGKDITNVGTVSVKIGDTLTITAKDEDKKVLHWLNDSNKVLGSDNSLKITVTGSMTITLVYESEAEGGQSAFVQFVSDYGQVLYAKLVSSYSEIEVPYAPSKLGYKFSGWVLGNTKVEADSTAVNEKIASGEKTITIKPTYTDNSSDFTVTLKYKLGDGIVEDRTVTKSYSIGKTLTLTAEPIEGYTFECWKNENGEVLGYSDSYVMQVTGDYTLIACYAAEGTTVEVKKPVISISELITVDEDDDIHKLSCVVTRNVPERYEVIEQGVLYGKNLGNLDFVYGDDGVKRYISNSLALNGVVRFNCKVTDLDLVVYFRGYMLLKDTETDNIEYYYSEIVYGSYNSIK